MREFTIGKNDAGQRLDRFVAKDPPLMVVVSKGNALAMPAIATHMSNSNAFLKLLMIFLFLLFEDYTDKCL